MPNYIDFRSATDLTKAVAAVFDPDTDREPGNALRYILLQQQTEDRASVTAYLTGNAWMTLYLPAFGVIGSKFLIDGEDLKSRVKGDIWNNAMRLSSTHRNVVKLECIIDAQRDQHPHIECGAYMGSVDEFEEPPFVEDTVATLTEGWKLRRAIGYINDFSKVTNDNRSRTIWFRSSDQELFCYGPENDGQSSISFIKCSAGPLYGADVDFGIQARHLPKVIRLFVENEVISIAFDKQRDCVRFSGDNGSLTLPLVDGFFCRNLSESAPFILSESAPLSQYSQRTFLLKELMGQVMIHTPKRDANSEDVLLQGEDTHLLITKQADVLKLEKSFAYFADTSGMDVPWQTVVANYRYLMPCLTVMAKYLRHLAAQAEYESGAESFGFEEEEDFALEEAAETDHVTLTQALWEAKGKWCLFIDPVPYSEDCRLFLSIKQPREVSDRLEGE